MRISDRFNRLAMYMCYLEYGWSLTLFERWLFFLFTFSILQKLNLRFYFFFYFNKMLQCNNIQIHTRNSHLLIENSFYNFFLFFIFSLQHFYSTLRRDYFHRTKINVYDIIRFGITLEAKIPNRRMRNTEKKRRIK